MAFRTSLEMYRCQGGYPSERIGILHPVLLSHGYSLNVAGSVTRRDLLDCVRIRCVIIDCTSLAWRPGRGGGTSGCRQKGTRAGPDTDGVIKRTKSEKRYRLKGLSMTFKRGKRSEFRKLPKIGIVRLSTFLLLPLKFLQVLTSSLFSRFSLTTPGRRWITYRGGR